MTKEKTITVRELKNELSKLDDDDQILFGAGDLSIKRVKHRDKDLAQIEFNEPYVITDS